MNIKIVNQCRFCNQYDHTRGKTEGFCRFHEVILYPEMICDDFQNKRTKYLESVEYRLAQLQKI